MSNRRPLHVASTRSSHSAVRRLRNKHGLVLDENNETHLEAYATLRRQAQAAGVSRVTGELLALHIRSLGKPVVPPPILSCWVVPRANFPHGLPPGLLAFLMAEEDFLATRGDYYFINQGNEYVHDASPLLPNRSCVSY